MYAVGEVVDGDGKLLRVVERLVRFLVMCWVLGGNFVPAMTT